MNVVLLTALSKLVIAGEQAGFTVEELIKLLDAGFGVETILDLIALRVDLVGKTSEMRASASHSLN